MKTSIKEILRQKYLQQKSIEPTVESKSSSIYENQIFLIDVMNLIVRNHSVNITLDNQGHAIGGVIGSLNSLYAIVRKFRPSKLIMVFEGDSSVARRQKLFPQYKANRKGKGQTNKKILYNEEHEAEENFNYQIFLLIQILQNLPIPLLSVDSYEADDIIAHICNDSSLKTNKITIVSSDNDYLQLVNENVSLYSPIKKIFYTEEEVFKEFEIYPHNFLLYKTLIGDNSDNIPKVNGVALKTLIKIFPEISSKEIVTQEMLLEYCRTKIVEKKCYKVFHEILNNVDLINLNKKLMDLSSINVPKIVSREIEDTLDENIELNLFNLCTICTSFEKDLFKPCNQFFNEFAYLTINK
jgi:DNA polymerase-1